MLDTHAFLTGYIAAAYWTDTGDIGQPTGNAEMGDSAYATAAVDCSKFILDAGDLLIAALDRPGYDAARAGHDFWLTRNGHGAGFWDRDELTDDDLGERLTEIAKRFPESDLYEGDNGMMYLS